MRKSRGKYTTLPGVDVMPWKDVAQNMRDAGYKMNTATARNHFNRAMLKLLKSISSELDLPPMDDKAMIKLAESDDFQLYIYEHYTNMLGDYNEPEDS